MRVSIVTSETDPVNLSTDLGAFLFKLEELMGEEIEPEVALGAKTEISFTIPEADKEEVRQMIKNHIGLVEHIEIE